MKPVIITTVRKFFSITTIYTSLNKRLVDFNFY